jgi:hypothetical protein
VSIGPATGAYPGAVEARDWIVRVHLARGDEPLAVEVERAGQEADGEPGLRPAWTRIEPMERRAALELPLLGDKDAPGPEAGAPVVRTVIERAAGGTLNIRL